MLTRRTFAALVATSIIARPSPAAAPATVAAASDLRLALDAIIAEMAKAGRPPVRVTYGSSGNLHRQILQGAPFEALFSADEIYADALIAAGKAEGPGLIYATGRLALVASGTLGAAATDAETALRAIAADPRLRRFAIANPEHAPYGARARETLTKLDLWTLLQNKLVLGENVAQALQFVATGAAEAGLVADPLLHGSLTPAVRKWLLPLDLHTPLRQKVVLTKGATPAARQLLVDVASPAGRAILMQHGFGSP